MNSDKSDARAYIFLNGDFVRPEMDWPIFPLDSDLVIAADGGARHAVDLDWPVHYLIGDMDSIEPEHLNTLENTEVIRYPASKNEIDFELALNLARKKGYANIVVLGALGGRWDMTFGNLFLPLATGWGSDGICFRHGLWTFWNVTGPASLGIKGSRGDLLSLMPMGEDVRGVSLSGCRYPLFSETLRAGLSRGLSNELLASVCRLDFSSGSLLVMHKKS